MTAKWYMPQYYQEFCCKMGACRNTCCGFWRIPVSREEYYKLTTMDCSEQLNEKVQNASILVERAALLLKL